MEKDLVRVCAWCNPQRLIKPDGTAGNRYIPDPNDKRPITHGMCKQCYKDAMAGATSESFSFISWLKKKLS
jgi:hypothetical protein